MCKIDSDLLGPLTAKLSRFCILSGSDMEALAQLDAAPVRTIPARQDIIAEGAAPKHVNLVLSGWACRYKQLKDGRRQIFAFFLPGDLCDLKIFILRKMDHSIGAIAPTTILEIPRESIIALTENASSIARALWWSSLVSESIEREWIVNIGQRTALERISHLICELFVRLETIGLVNGMSCQLPLTQIDLAESTGLSAVHVNRTLNELRGTGLLDWKGRTLTIHHFDRLKTLAMFTPNYLHLDEGDTALGRAANTTR